MFTWIRKRQARARGIPFADKTFWPPYYINFGGRIPGNTVLRKLYEAKTGEIVPVMQSDKEVHFYRIVSAGCASGDDHIVSPLQWNIVYHHSEERHDDRA